MFAELKSWLGDKCFYGKQCLLACSACPGLDIKLIRCCPQYDVKLMWRHRGNDIVSVAAICAAAQMNFLFGLTRLAV